MHNKFTYMETEMISIKVIDQFTGEYAFLSNFHPCRVSSFGLTYPSVEAAFQAAKCADPKERAQFLTLTPAQAKRRGRHVQMRPDWEQRKLAVMRDLLAHKFQENPELIPKLLATGKSVLVEGNTWHDNFWGSCTCPHCAGRRGCNHLGKLLMNLRTGYYVRTHRQKG